MCSGWGRATRHSIPRYDLQTTSVTHTHTHTVFTSVKVSQEVKRSRRYISPPPVVNHQRRARDVEPVHDGFSFLALCKNKFFTFRREKRAPVLPGTGTGTRVPGLWNVRGTD